MTLKINLTKTQQEMILPYLRKRYAGKFGHHSKKIETYIEVFLLDFAAAESKKESDAALERLNQESLS